MEKLGLIFTFTGTVIIWIDAFVLASYIGPNRIILSGNAGYKIIISKFFLHIGLLLLVIGFLLQLLAYGADEILPKEVNNQAYEKRNQIPPHDSVDTVPPCSQTHIITYPPSNPRN